MSDTKHTPEMHEDANAVFDCLKYHASAGGEYEYRGTLAIEAFTRMCNEIAVLRAAAEKARECLESIECGVIELAPSIKRREALATLEEVLK
jgi:hypothetical protein